ncbi:MAG: hypothetical protein DKINENOH_05142 [bacterium]|nr:hypothetical protein [bacterium]
MQRNHLSILIGALLAASVAQAQWQPVPAPSDRVFTFALSGTRLFAGSEDSGLWLSTNGGASFQAYPTGLPEMAYDIRALEVRQDTLWAAILGGGVCRSVDGDTTWISFNEGFETQAFAAGVVVMGDTVYAAIEWAPGLQPSGVYKTAVQQANWRRSGTGFPSGLSGITALAVTESGVMLVGATLGGSSGHLQVSLDRGATWQNRSLAGVQGVLSLAVAGETIYAGTTSGLYVSLDSAKTWQSVGTELQNAVVDDLLLFNQTLCAAVDGVGVVASANGGASWNVLTGNLPISGDFVSAIFIHHGRLFAGLSASHGVWSRPLPATGVDDGAQMPGAITLLRNYPNPFNPATTISFQLAQPAVVTLKVYNLLGREVATLVNRELKPAGANAVAFEARGLASGVYFYRLTAGSQTKTQRMVLAR